MLSKKAFFPTKINLKIKKLYHLLLDIDIITKIDQIITLGNTCQIVASKQEEQHLAKNKLVNDFSQFFKECFSEETLKSLLGSLCFPAPGPLLGPWPWSWPQICSHAIKTNILTWFWYWCWKNLFFNVNLKLLMNNFLIFLSFMNTFSEAAVRWLLLYFFKSN